jgi:hypothetical protein
MLIIVDDADDGEDGTRGDPAAAAAAASVPATGAVDTSRFLPSTAAELAPLPAATAMVLDELLTRDIAMGSVPGRASLPPAAAATVFFIVLPLRTASEKNFISCV